MKQELSNMIQMLFVPLNKLEDTKRKGKLKKRGKFLKIGDIFILNKETYLIRCAQAEQSNLICRAGQVLQPTLTMMLSEF